MGPPVLYPPAGAAIRSRPAPEEGTGQPASVPGFELLLGGGGLAAPVAVPADRCYDRRRKTTLGDVGGDDAGRVGGDGAGGKDVSASSPRGDGLVVTVGLAEVDGEIGVLPELLAPLPPATMSASYSTDWVVNALLVTSTGPSALVIVPP